jgi:hypothetical protein
MMQGPSDHFIMHGYRHKCVCGRFWYDSDGGPCHWPCKICEKLTVVDDMEDDMCPKCQDEAQDES